MHQINIHALYRSSGHSYKGRAGKGSLSYEVETCETFDLVAGSGIIGDRFYDYKPDFKGQITFFDWAVYEEVQRKFNLPDLHPSAFRRNVMVSGIDLNSLIGQRFSINGIEFSGSEEAAPCFWMDEAAADGVHQHLMGKGGLRCRIHTDGTLPTGVHDLSY